MKTYYDRNGTKIQHNDMLLVGYLGDACGTSSDYVGEVIAKEDKSEDITLYDHCEICFFGERIYSEHKESHFQLNNYPQQNIQILGNITNNSSLLEHKKDLPDGTYGTFQSVIKILEQEI